MSTFSIRTDTCFVGSMPTSVLSLPFVVGQVSYTIDDRTQQLVPVAKQRVHNIGGLSMCSYDLRSGGDGITGCSFGCRDLSSVVINGRKCEAVPCERTDNPRLPQGTMVLRFVPAPFPSDPTGLRGIDANIIILACICGSTRVGTNEEQCPDHSLDCCAECCTHADHTTESEEEG